MARYGKRVLKVWSSEYDTATDAEMEGKLVAVQLAAGQQIGSKELALALNCMVAAVIALDSPWELCWSLSTEKGKQLDQGVATSGAECAGTLN